MGGRIPILQLNLYLHLLGGVGGDGLPGGVVVPPPDGKAGVVALQGFAGHRVEPELWVGGGGEGDPLEVALGQGGLPEAPQLVDAAEQRGVGRVHRGGIHPVERAREPPLGGAGELRALGVGEQLGGGLVANLNRVLALAPRPLRGEAHVEAHGGLHARVGDIAGHAAGVEEEAGPELVRADVAVDENVGAVPLLERGDGIAQRLVGGQKGDRPHALDLADLEAGGEQLHVEDLVELHPDAVLHGVDLRRVDQRGAGLTDRWGVDLQKQ